MENKIEQKPLTYVNTYRNVNGFSSGLHKGENRDVFIIQGGNEGDTISRYDAEKSFQNAESRILDGTHLPENLEKRMDRAYVYLGANGASPGFRYVERMKQNRNLEIGLVACDCGEKQKQFFANKHELQITWSSCGGSGTLAEIVKRELS